MLNVVDFIMWPFNYSLLSLNFIFGILMVVFWVWMLVDLAKRKFRNDIEKFGWVLVLLFATVIGAFVYSLIIRMNNPRGLVKK